MYDCSQNDRAELESIQEKILERIRELRDYDLPIREDTVLENYYAINAQVQNCILNDYTFTPITMGVILGIGVTICLSYYLRIWKKRKKSD